MAELSTALQSAIQQDRILITGFVKIVFPTATVRLLDGSGAVSIGGELYTGRDSTYGVLDYIRGIEDKLDSKTPDVQLGLIPATDAAISTLISPTVQGSPVTIGIAVINQATGLAVDAGYTLFVGQIDVPTLRSGMNDRRIEYTITTAAERLFTIEEGRRLSDAFHKSVWPGENGLFAVTEIEYPVAWGQLFDNNQYQIRTDNGSAQGGLRNSIGGGNRFGGFNDYA